MRREFQPGDRVQSVDDDLEGRVVGQDSEGVLIRTAEGFEFTVAPGDLIPLPENPHLPVPRNAGRVAGRLESEYGNKRRRQQSRGGSRRERDVRLLETDLHADKLTNDPRKLSAHEILDLQIETARRQIEYAIRERIQRVILIHGVGEGVLKAELETLIRRFDGLRCQEADFRHYGTGATEVYIPQEIFQKQ